MTLSFFHRQKWCFLLSFEYADSNFRVNFDRPVQIGPRSVPWNYENEQISLFKILMNSQSGLKFKFFKLSLKKHIPIHWSCGYIFFMHRIYLTHLNKRVIFWEGRSRVLDTWYKNIQNLTLNSHPPSWKQLRCKFW